MSAERIREAVIAGTWYPDRPETLQKEIEKYLGQAAVTPLDGELVGIVVPHAGYAYSGGVAAHAFRLLEAQPFERVLILAPSHRAFFKGASVYHQGGYRTPLGVVPLDRETVEALMEHTSLIVDVPHAHTQEHSLEIQLPFLQVVLKDFRMTPLVMGEHTFDACNQLAELIAQVCRDKRILLVASSDLSHYHPYREAQRLDQVVIDRLTAFDPQGLARSLEKGDCEACGGWPMITLMLAAQKLGASSCKLLKYANSGDVTGESREVVGYMSAVLVKTGREATRDREQEEGVSKTRVGVDLGLSEEEKETLKSIAHEAIQGRCLGKTIPHSEVESAKLQELRGAFVTLRKAGELRGCIGMIEGRSPLHETIRSMAVQAAFADPRFSPLKPEELDQITMEISVLTPLVRIHDPSEIQIGKHGLYIRKGYYSGLLLPQVATEQNWDRSAFLEWTCRKAGLSPQAWKDPEAELYIFSADIF